LRISLLLIIYAMCLSGQAPLVNLDFELSGADGLPLGWTVPKDSRHFEIRHVTQGCRNGNGCVEMKPGPETALRFGLLEQRVDAGNLAGKNVIFSVLVYGEKGAQSALQMRVEDSSGKVIAMDNNVMNALVGKGVWEATYLSVGIPHAASKVSLGILSFGGRVLVDTVSIPSFTINSNKGPRIMEARSRLNRTAQNNLMAFARLYGVVRYFDPSDQAAETDWLELALRGVKTLDYAIMAPSLGRRMGEVFEAASPGLKFYMGVNPPLGKWLSPEGKEDLMRWRYDDSGKGARVVEPVSTWSEADLRIVNLGRGLLARVPTAVFREAGFTLPRATVAGPRVAPTTLSDYTGNDRATRLMIVILAWNALQHFHAVPADWEDALVRGMQRAAVDEDAEAFVLTLQEMVGVVGMTVSYQSGAAADGLELPGGYRIHKHGSK
jgi:hypothetical protein